MKLHVPLGGAQLFLESCKKTKVANIRLLTHELDELTASDTLFPLYLEPERGQAKLLSHTPTMVTPTSLKFESAPNLTSLHMH
jgi:hypothetical protein